MNVTTPSRGKTFRSISDNQGIDWQPEPNPSSLTLWTLSIQDVPLEDLELEDVCRAVRQDLFTSELLPFAVSALDNDVLAGFMLDAELLKAVSELPNARWAAHRDQATRMLSILHRDKALIAGGADALAYSKTLEEKLWGVLNARR